MRASIGKILCFGMMLGMLLIPVAGCGGQRIVRTGPESGTPSRTKLTMRGATTLAGLRGHLNELGINLTIACDPSALVMFVGELDIRELSQICQIQHTCNLYGSPKYGFLAVPWDSKFAWAPIRVRFALGSADAFWAPGAVPDFAALVALGEIRVVPGGRTTLQLGETRYVPRYVTAGQVVSGSSGQLVSEYETRFQPTRP